MPTIYKPSWIRHEGASVYSVDIHPDGTKIATGGGDNRAHIWQLSSVLTPPQDATNGKTQLKALCSISGHEQSVNVVRWSPNGRWLATGSSDGRVGLAERTANPTEFGAAAGSEVWRLRQYLAGSKMEIWDIAWSPDSSKVVGCCHDQNVYVWDIAAGGQLLTILKGHSSVVKGVVWDPIGTFVATQDDTSMIVWKVDGWKIEKQITEPFQRTPATSTFRRPSWTPDGGILIGAAATVSGTQAPLLIEREKWTYSHFPVGHRSFIGATAANPSMFDGSQGPFLCYALADVNQLVTVWTTQQENAVTAIAHGVEKPVTDLRWSPDGCVLVASSLDGTVLVVNFAPGELGKRISEHEKEAKLRSRYGHSGGALFEDPALLALYQERKQRQLEDEAATRAQQQQMAQMQRANPTAPQKQTETIVKGRRKIMPVLVSGPESALAAPSDPSDAFRSIYSTGNLKPITNGNATESSSAPQSTSVAAAPSLSTSTQLVSSSTPPVRSQTAPQNSTGPKQTSMDIDSPATTPNEKKRGRPIATVQIDSDGEDEATAKASTTPAKKVPPPAFGTSVSVPVPLPLPTTASMVSGGAGSAFTAIGPLSPLRTSVGATLTSALRSPGGLAAPPLPGQVATFSVAPNAAMLGTIGISGVPAAATSPFSSPTQPASALQSSQASNGGGQVNASHANSTSLISQLAAAKKTSRPRGRKPKAAAATIATDAEYYADDAGSERVGTGGPRLLLPLPYVEKRFWAKIAGKPVLDGGSSASNLFSSVPASSSSDSASEDANASAAVLEVTITVDDDGFRPPKSALKYMEGKVTAWQDQIEDKVTVMTGNTTNVVAVGCASGDLYLYSPSGRRTFPTINVSSYPICALECLGSTLLAVTCDGIVRVWDLALGIAKADTTLHNMMAKHYAIQAERQPNDPVLNNRPTADFGADEGAITLQDFISRFAVSETGQALFVMYSGHIYGYSTMMASWTCLYAPNWQKDVDKNGLALGQLSSLQRAAQRAGSATASSSYSSYHGMAIEERRQRSIAHLESQVASAALFGTAQEYRHFAKLYVRELADLLYEKKLIEFTNSLMGPIHHSLTPTASWDPFIHGIPKRDILEEVLPEMLRPELQRIIAMIKESLQNAKALPQASNRLRSPPPAHHTPTTGTTRSTTPHDLGTSTPIHSATTTKTQTANLLSTSNLSSSTPTRSFSKSSMDIDEEAHSNTSQTSSKPKKSRAKATSSQSIVIEDSGSEPATGLTRSSSATRPRNTRI